MALITQDQFFELWFPGSYWDQANKALGGHDTAGARRNARESENGRRQFNEAWNSFNQRQILLGSASDVEEPFYGYKAPPSMKLPTFQVGQGNFRDYIAQFDAAQQAQTDYLRESNKALQAITEQKYALAQQQKEEEKVKTEYQKVLTETQQQAAVVKKQSQAVVNRQRAQSSLSAAQARQEAQRVAPEQTQQTRRSQNVGQPGVSRTRVSGRFGIGGYGGTAPGRVNPTGLNI
jgi:hypothetical protein